MSSMIPYVCDQLAMARLKRASFVLHLALLPAPPRPSGKSQLPASWPASPWSSPGWRCIAATADDFSCRIAGRPLDFPFRTSIFL
jgi:hypothetical protein